MKTLLLLLTLLPVMTYADQFSYQENTRVTDTSQYYGSHDRKFQYNFDIDDNYLFLGYRRAGTCPYYCGINYDMYGIGYGINHKSDWVTLFAQIGYYKIDNNINETKQNDNLYYYLNARFASFDNPKSFKSYSVTNSDTFGITVGADLPLNNWMGIKLSYQYMKMKEIIRGNFNEEETIYWHDPVNRDMSTISAGVYVNF